TFRHTYRPLISTLSLHDALPIFCVRDRFEGGVPRGREGIIAASELSARVVLDHVQGRRGGAELKIAAGDGPKTCAERRGRGPRTKQSKQHAALLHPALESVLGLRGEALRVIDNQRGVAAELVSGFGQRGEDALVDLGFERFQAELDNRSLARLDARCFLVCADTNEELRIAHLELEAVV